MANELAEWQVRQWSSNVHMLAQQMKSKLRGTTMEQTGAAERFGFDRLAAMRGRRPTGRLEPIIHAIAEHSRRWVFPAPYSFDAIADQFERMRTIHEPSNEYTMAGAADYNREVDNSIITAALGAALEGEQTPASSPFDTTNQLIAAAADGLTVDKVVAARSIIGHHTAEEMEMYGPYYVVYDPSDVRLLFASVQMTSTDFVNKQALMSGRVVEGYLGLNWMPSNQLPLGVTAANIRNMVMYAKAGMGFGANSAARKERAGERNDITGHPMQISIFDQFGAVRIDDRLVVRIDVDTTVVPT
jgi:hypothetical protein